MQSEHKGWKNFKKVILSNHVFQVFVWVLIKKKFNPFGNFAWTDLRSYNIRILFIKDKVHNSEKKTKKYQKHYHKAKWTVDH